MRDENFKLQASNFKLNKGFTLVELLVSIGILAVVFAMVSINLSNLPSNTVQTSNLDVLISDVRAQQTLSMATDSPYGIYLNDTSYTLFKGSTYVEGSVGNFTVNLDSGISITEITFPNSEIVFLAGSGDLSGYSTDSDGFTLVSANSGKSTVISINKYGATY